MPDTKEPTFVTGFLIHDVSRLRKKMVDKELQPLGITRSQWWALVNIARHGSGGIAQTDLAKSMSVGKVSLGGVIDRLEAANLLERRPDPNDRRAKKVVLTRKGQSLLKKMQDIAVKINAKIMKGVTKEQNAILDEALKIMKKNLVMHEED